MQHIHVLWAIVFILFLQHISIAQCVFPPSPDGIDCHDAKFVCGYELDGYTSTLPDTILSEDYPIPFCPGGGNINNMHWLSFFVCDDQIALNVIPSNCTVGADNLEGIQVAIYEDCSYTNSKYCQVSGSASPFVVVAGDLIPGNLYYLVLDGNGGSICDFTIDVIYGIDTDPIVLSSDPDSSPDEGTIIGPQSNCTGTFADYNFTAPSCVGHGFSSGCVYSELHLYNFICYEWTINPPTGFQIIGNPTAPDIQIEWEEEGIYEITMESYVNPDFAACTVPGTSCGEVETLVVEVLEFQINELPIIQLCEGECVTFCDVQYCSDTSFYCPQTLNPCIIDYINIEILTSDTIELGVIPQCFGTCFEISDTSICVPGQYFILDHLDCSTIYAFELEATEVNIDIPSLLELNCTDEQWMINPSIENLSGMDLTPYWIDENFDTISFDYIIELSEAGNYTFELVNDQLASCSFSANVEVIENFSIPILEWQTPVLNCVQNNDQFILTNAAPIESISWTGPNNFDSSELEPWINEGGLYIAQFTGENGCSSLDSFQIIADTEAIQAMLSYEHIDCYQEFSAPSIASQQDIQEFLWAGPSNFMSNQEKPLLFEAGMYSISLTAANGCTWTEDFEIQDLRNIPVIIIDNPNPLWYCNTESITIEANVEVAGSADILWTTENGMILSDAKQGSVIVDQIGSYYISVEDPENGCMNFDTVHIIQNEDIPEAMILSVQDEICYGTADGYFSIENIQGGVAPYEVYVNGDLITEDWELSALTPGDYEIQIYDAFDCSYSDIITIETGVDLVVEAPEEIWIELLEEKEISVSHNINFSEINNIQWYNSDEETIGFGSSIFYNYDGDSFLRVIVEHNNGCLVESIIQIRIQEVVVQVYAPNIFSPNQDGVNDYFCLFSDDSVSEIAELAIFDRWGNRMYFAKGLIPNDESSGWDGSLNGKAVAIGTYIYVAQIIDKNGEKVNMSGDVQLIR